MLYILNLYSDISQLFLSKIGAGEGKMPCSFLYFSLVTMQSPDDHAWENMLEDENPRTIEKGHLS